MKKQIPTTCLIMLIIGMSILFLTTCSLPVHAQGPTSSIGSRENIGIYGGAAGDLAFVPGSDRLFAAVKSAGTLFFSDDICNTWQPAFPFDSLEYQFGARGWGGEARRVLTNQSGWTLVHTILEPQRSAAVVSYGMGNFGTFKTAIDPFLLDLLTGEEQAVSAIYLTDYFAFAGVGKYLIRTNETTPFGTGMILARMDTVPGIYPDPVIKSIAAANNPSGLPLYVVVESAAGSGDGLLYLYNGTLFTKVPTLPPDFSPHRVFTHPGTLSADTAFLSGVNMTNQSIMILRTYNKWFTWNDITPSGGVSRHLADADYSPGWVGIMPLSKGLRLSFPGGQISDNMGNTWSFQPLPGNGIASHPLNPSLIVGSTNEGTVVSQNSVFGPFVLQSNIGFEAVEVFNFSESMGIYYVATRAGLAYTEEYNNPGIVGHLKWTPPNGLFPVQGVGDEEGVSAVAVNPANSMHVICGYKGGFAVTFSGPGGFFDVIPPGWNNTTHTDPYVTDIQFVTSSVVIAVTGYLNSAASAFPQQTAGNIWRSDDGGLNWLPVTPYFPEPFQMGNCLTVGFDGVQYIIYAGTGGNDPVGTIVPGGLWKSFDQGNTWFKVNNGPINAFGEPQPIVDIDLLPGNTDVLYLSSGNTFARSNDGGISYFYPYIPNNTNQFSSALIVPAFPDSVIISDGNQVFRYNYMIDDADLVFRGYPGEKIHTLAYGSTLSGTTTGGYYTGAAPRYYLSITAMLQGPFSGIEMNTTLNANGYLPLSQPFNQAPWNYYGTENVSSIPNADIVDWVLIEIRQASSGAGSATSKKRIIRQACFIKKDGSLVGKDGMSDPRFNFVITEDLYGIIYHPNHVGIMSASALGQVSESFTYNFTTGSGQVYGGSNGCRELALGVWGLASGDGDGDGQVTTGDKNDVWSLQSGSAGYLSGDFNRDSQVNNSDKIDHWAPNAGFGSQVVP